MTRSDHSARYRFTKAERLSSRKLIRQLFAEGRSFYLEPLIVRYLPLPGGSPHHQVLISVPARLFKKATERNRLKRQLREAYRLHKHLLKAFPRKLAIAYIYHSKEKLPYRQIEDVILRSLHRLAKAERQYEKNS